MGENPLQLDKEMWEKNQKIMENIIIKGRLLVIDIISLPPNFLALIIAFFAGYPYFCFAKSFIIGFAIGEMESKDTHIAVDIFKWSL